MAGLIPQYIVRMHNRKTPWEQPKYFVGNTSGAWLDGAFKHAEASILVHEEARHVIERFPGSVMLRVG